MLIIILGVTVQKQYSHQQQPEVDYDECGAVDMSMETPSITYFFLLSFTTKNRIVG